MAKRHVVVVGAGIGGLTAALALHRRGWQVTVCERSSQPPTTGAGIGLAPNALRALDALGIDAAHAAGTAVPETMGLRRFDGRWLTRARTADMAARYGMPPIAVPRPAFTAALAAALPPQALRYGTAVTAVDDATGRPTVRTANGPDLSADLVIAADGINSPLRRAHFPTHPGLRYTGESAWRALVDAPDLRIEAMSETWGHGRRFGVTPLTDGRLYLYATALVPAGTRPAGPDPAPNSAATSAPGTIRSPPSSTASSASLPPTSSATTSTIWPPRSPDCTTAGSCGWATPPTP
ncbi:FAD-dependent oxidoreductase [Streptomyces sp. NPDC005533]|uniref:FAD-dependent oxidoreductase n=1 Tax=Streptomyces sp. NPDC005533 TaxID=3364723 RepID=UPI0036ABFE82